ncbi:MAG: PTS sugar transporter subunit IIC [Spiroplasma sp.]|nr:PTS sugar transporter subunit IIC [Mycoplasmatales bacterium]
MKKFNEWLEKNLLPIGAKIGTQKHLGAIRDGFISILPLTMVGSVAVLLNVLLRDIPTSLGNEDFVAAVQPIIEINGAIWWGSLAMMALMFTFSFAYNLAKASNVAPLPAAIVAVVAFITTMPQTVPESVTGGDGIWGYLGSSYLGATGLFTAMIITIITIEIYSFLIRKNITIKMPDSVPPAVSKSFTAVIPGVISIYVISIISYIVLQMTGIVINDLVSTVILNPLLNLSQGLPAVLLINILTQLFWFVGIHGMNVLAPIYESLWGVALIENIEAIQLGLEVPYIWATSSFFIYAHFGGTGGTLALILGIFVFGKRADTKAISKLALPPGIFNINEPIVFGFPIILNPIYFIPWILIPTITITIGYVFTAAGIVGPVVAAVPWVTPVGLYAFLSTAGNIPATLLSLAMFALTFVMWIPFIFAAEKTENNKREQND